MPGYNEDFLDGITIPLPSFSIYLEDEILIDDDLEDSKVANYVNYSVIMNKHRDKRSPVLVALNIDQNQLKSTKRRDNWRIDRRIGSQNQLDNDYYRGKDNHWDRGHMARRISAAWGNSVQDAQRGSNETFYYSNSCLQHKNLNQDEWLGLEDWVYQLKEDLDGRISSFSGPIYGENDRTIRPSGRDTALIPAGFFKIVCFIHKDTKQLAVRAFVMYQDEKALRDRRGRRRYNNQTYQTTVTEIEELTGIQFHDSIYQANPLFYSDEHVTETENVVSTPENIEVGNPDDIVRPGDRRLTINDDDVDVFIASAMVNPAGEDRNHEWISLINLGSQATDISGWTLQDNSHKDLDIDSVLTDPAQRVLKPGESRIIGPLGALRLSNTQDVIKLFDQSKNRIDWVNYTKSMVKIGTPVVFLTPRDTLDL